METGILTGEEKRELLRIARTVVANRLEGRDGESLPPPLEGLNVKRGCFVTLHKRGELRGCIGTFEGSVPLWETVARMAVSAAFGDPRFAPLRREELVEIDFEISVLSPLKEIKEMGEIEVGRDGIYVTKGRNRGVLLPQVATEYGWDAGEFLSHTCLKAGLPADEWKRGVRMEVFSAQVFGEKGGEE